MCFTGACKEYLLYILRKANSNTSSLTLHCIPILSLNMQHSLSNSSSDPEKGRTGTFAAALLLGLNGVELLTHTKREKNGQATEQAV